MSINKYGEKIGRSLDLPMNLIRGMPTVHITGNSEILIEGHKGILQYDNDIIKIAAKNMSISFLGQNLSLRTLNSENIVIQGNLQSVGFSQVFISGKE